MEDLHFVHVNYPVDKQLDKKTPLSCLESMGLLDKVDLETPSDSQCMEFLTALGTGNASTILWQKIGGVDITYLKDPLIFFTNGEVEGPCDISDMEKSPIVFCKARGEKTGKACMIMFAVSRMNKVADLCAYDPSGTATEENMYQMVGTAGAWIRELLGEGWGLRMEVYHDRYCPSEIPDFAKFWAFLMCLLKVYLPHVRMIDTQAALRVECFSKNMTMRSAMSTALHNVYTMCQ